MIHKRAGAVLLTLDDSHVLFSVVHNHEDLSESLKYCKCLAFASCLQQLLSDMMWGSYRYTY